MLSDALRGVRAFIDPGQPQMSTYIHGSKIVMAAVVMTAAIVPDGVLFWLLIPHRLWWIAALSDIADVWTALWLFAIYGSMARLPHEISPEKIVLRNGSRQSIELHPGQIGSATLAGLVKRRAVPRGPGERIAFLTFGGVPLVDVKLNAPAHGVDRILVASDNAELLAAELLRLAKTKNKPAAAAAATGS